VIGPDQAPYAAAGQPFNEIVVDAAGRAWVDMPGAAPWEDPKPGVVAVVLPDGNSHQVADAVWFPNGMVLIGDYTLVVAESHADRLTGWTIADSAELVDRRVWTDLGPGSAPDGICADAEGAIWYASVPGQRCTVSPKAVRCWTPSESTAARYFWRIRGEVDDSPRQARPPAGERMSERPAHLLPAVGCFPVRA